VAVPVAETTLNSGLDAEGAHAPTSNWNIDDRPYTSRIRLSQAGVSCAALVFDEDLATARTELIYVYSHRSRGRRATTAGRRHRL